MHPPPSDTFFTASPHWGWFITLYFFFGGLAGGSFFLGSLLDLFGTQADRRLARLAYVVTMPCLAVSPPLLVVDLDRPERFWHMMIMSERVPMPMLKWWSPMSFGSWALLLFGGFAALGFLGALAEEDAPRYRLFRPFRALRRSTAARVIIAAGGGFFALLVAGYTGVLLAVTNRPIWADTTLIGALFTVSAASTSAALLLLVGRKSGVAAPESLRWLAALEVKVALLELFVLAAVVVSLGPVARVWMGGWGVLLAVGVVLLGILVPVGLHLRPRLAGAWGAVAAPILVLVGGLVLRAVVVLSSEAV